MIGTLLLGCFVILAVWLFFPMDLQHEVYMLRVEIMLLCIAYLLELNTDDDG